MENGPDFTVGRDGVVRSMTADRGKAAHGVSAESVRAKWERAYWACEEAAVRALTALSEARRARAALVMAQRIEQEAFEEYLRQL